MIVDNKVETKTFCAAGDQVGINVRNWVCTDIVGDTSFDDQILVDELSKRVALLHKPFMPSVASYLGMYLATINVPGIPSGVVTSHLGTGAGTASGDLLPRQASALLHFETVLAGRHGRGRMYIPFGTEDFNTSAGELITIGLAVADALRLFYGTPQTVSNAGVHCQLWPAVRDRATNVLTLIFESRTEKRWATQRRRGQFGRQNPIPEL